MWMNNLTIFNLTFPLNRRLTSKIAGMCVYYKKLSYRREAARCLVLLSTLVSR